MGKLSFPLIVLALLTSLLAGCAMPPPAAGGSAMAPAAEERFSVLPDPVDGSFNAVLVHGGEVAAGGWDHAHNEGRLYLERTVEGVATAHVENVSDGVTREVVLRTLADRGFDLIITASFDFMDATAAVAQEFPNRGFVNVSGQRSNDTNFASLFGAMETSKYLAGMVAGARAAEDGSYRVGYLATVPVPEIVRLGNALVLGMRRTCPDCVMDLHWLMSWDDPEAEAAAAASMLDAGITVIASATSTPLPLLLGEGRSFTYIPDKRASACEDAPDACLTATYWLWGPAYVPIVQDMMDGNLPSGNRYYGFPEDMLGLYGFMEGQVPQPMVPDWVVPEVRAVLQAMRSGEFTRFDIFTGPIHDNQGNLIVPEGVSLMQSDLEGIAPELGTHLGRPGCTICMNWLAEGFAADAVIPE
ncbi:MAG: BMP family ABC transporter substrate-binding protein [Caldilineaceae bacterium]|nr:BMP family ABC transporter substrate-binding protein [Caldilineaceae bacterium]